MKQAESLDSFGKDSLSPRKAITLLLEFVPLLVFFLAHRMSGSFTQKLPFLNPEMPPLFVATIFLMGVTTLTVPLLFFLTRRLPLMPLITALLVGIFGALTLFFQNDLFIKLKPTIVNLLLGGVLLGGLAFGKSLLTPLLGTVLSLDPEGWNKLTLRWALFFFFLAGLNMLISQFFSTAFWVTFKVFGILPLTLLFAAFQMPLMMRHSKGKAKSEST